MKAPLFAVAQSTVIPGQLLRSHGSDTVSHPAADLAAAPSEQIRVCAMAESFATTTDGKPFNDLYHIFFEISDGKIVRAREYNDTAHVFSTLRA